MGTVKPQKPSRQRLDTLVVQRDLAQSRDRAKRLILAGQIFVEGERATKPGRLYPKDVQLTLRGEDIPYVSRGGLKLEKALEVFQLDVAGLVALDIGASTGGFTDCLLQRGAAHVIALDVGRGQLAYKLRLDPRVTVMERTNARYLTPDLFDRPIQFLCIDVSFISLHQILGAARSVVVPSCRGVVLLKPQFEAGRRQVGRGGVVRDPAIHEALLIEKPKAWQGWGIRAVTPSPIRGPAGNLEYLIYLEALPDPNAAARLPADWAEQVELAVVSGPPAGRPVQGIL